MRTRRSLCVLLLSGGLLLQTTGCTLKATINQTTDTTSNITGTTSGHAWWNEDGMLKSDYKIAAFTSYNQANLEQDLARGQGEYLTSLGTLLGISDDRQAMFQSHAQDGFSTLVSSDHATRIAQLRSLAR